MLFATGTDQFPCHGSREIKGNRECKSRQYVKDVAVKPGIWGHSHVVLFTLVRKRRVHRHVIRRTSTDRGGLSVALKHDHDPRPFLAPREQPVVVVQGEQFGAVHSDVSGMMKRFSSMNFVRNRKGWKRCLVRLLSIQVREYGLSDHLFVCQWN